MGGTMSITLNGTTGITTPDLTSAAPMDVGGSAVLTAASDVLTSVSSLAAANLTGSLPAIDGSAVTSLTSANLTGALPAIDGSALSGVGTSTAFAAVGTYTIGRPANTTSYTQGDTTSAFYATQSTNRDLTAAYYNEGPVWTGCTISAQAGTWRCMGDAKSFNYGGVIMGVTGLWVRIS